MDGYEFEYQCAKILRQKHFSKIEVTRSSGDQGVDIIAFKHRKKYGIQCKYYTYPVGNKAVQEAYAGANFYDCDKAMVMTNTTFTRSATQLAEKLEVELWPNCPTTPFYGLLFKIMGLLNAVLFLYAMLTLLASKPGFDLIHLPVTLDTITLMVVLTASALGIFGWRFSLCNLITAGAYFYLAVQMFLLPAYAKTGRCTYTQLLSLAPACMYLLHAGWLRLQIRKS